MNNDTRMLLSAVCNDDTKQAKSLARLMLQKINTEKDADFKTRMLERLERNSRGWLNLNDKVSELIRIEYVDAFPTERYLIRPAEQKITEQILNTFQVAAELSKKNIRYVPAAILYGESGCGKTMLAKYIAYKAHLPLVYLRFSELVSSYLGKTASNIAKIFALVKENPCVLCMDEMDYIGIERGDSRDVSEMSRVVIALMQEMDLLNNDVIVIGTTNRFDRLDPALVRRFPESLRHQVTFLNRSEARELAQMYFGDADISLPNSFDTWCDSELMQRPNETSAAHVIDRCTEYIVNCLVKKLPGGA